jgi:hypothetical protein
MLDGRAMGGGILTDYSDVIRLTAKPDQSFLGTRSTAHQAMRPFPG